MLKSADKIKMTKATIAVDRHKCKLLTIIRGLWQTFLIKKSISMEFIYFICFFVVGLQWSTSIVRSMSKYIFDFKCNKVRTPPLCITVDSKLCRL